MPNIYQDLSIHALTLLDKLAVDPARRIYNLSLPHFALLLSCYQDQFIVIEDTDEAAGALYNDFLFFRQLLRGGNRNVSLFPPASSPELIGKRASVLLESIAKKNLGIITSAGACATGFSLSGIRDKVFTISKGLSLEREKLKSVLAGLGYNSVSVVVGKGEYSHREWILDIYPSTEEMPVRVEFWGDEIEMIRSFDIETQRSVRETPELAILPASEDSPASTLIDELAQHTNPGVFVSESTNTRKGTYPIFLRNTGCVPFFVSHMPFAGEGVDATELSIKGMGILSEERKELGDIPAALKKAGSNTLIVLSSEAQADRLKNILFEGGEIVPVIKSKDLESYEGGSCITMGVLSAGIRMQDF